MPNSHGSFIWYELITPDPDGAAAFYDAVVGWTVGPPTQDGMEYRHIERSDGGQTGGVMRLTDQMRGGGARPVWLGYVAVDDVDRIVAAMETDGAKAMMPAFDIPNVGRIAMLADPDGAPFYVIAPSPPPEREGEDSDAFSTDQPQRVRWNELATSDADGAVAFYGRHFGWTQEGGMPMGELGTYRFIQHQGEGIGAIMPRMPQMPVSMWTHYIGVDDIDRAASAVTANGGKILQGPMEIPGGEFALNAMDPQGAAFALVGPRSK